MVMADIDVKEIAVLRTYCSKLNDFKVGTTAVGVLINRQVRKIKSDLEDKRHEASNNMNYVKEQGDKVISRYDYALSQCSNARPYIGETDRDCKDKIREAEDLVVQISEKIRQLETELENAGQHTKNFCLQVLNMTESCQTKINKTIASLETYKGIN